MGCLYHHGIKGQKWGKRNGPPYPLKEEDYSSAEKVADKRITDEQKAALRKIAIGVSVTAGAALVVYGLKQYGDMNLDRTIKAGKTIQHMSRTVDEMIDHPFYASYMRSDNKIYGKNDFKGSNWKAKMNLVASKDIKIANNKKAEKYYREWLEKDQEAKKRFGNQSWFSFNKNLNSPDMYDKERFKRFYDYIQSKGYDAIRDRNDQYQTGTKSPIIIFGKLGDISVTEIQEAAKR